VVTTILETTSYDPAGRLLQTKQKINSQPEVLIAAFEYNELDQVVSKKLHSIDLGVNYLQSLNYTYNERGWLKSINDVAISSTGNTKFGMQFAYENAPFPQYNGNVGQTKWKTARTATSPQLGYDYKYDNLDRLIAAESSTGVVKDKNYSEYASYDQMGNIKTLGRYALIFATGTRGQIDSLKYTYNTNRHTSVNDVSTGAAAIKVLGFNDKVQVVDEYVYDGNGRIISDKNSEISGILYNAANLPRQITWTGTPARKLEYMYSADGTKLQKRYTSGTTVTTTDYVAGIQYLTSTGGSAAIDFIQTSEGRARYNGSLFAYEYDLKDNLGNTRVTITADPGDATQRTAKVIQENSYYPFGLVMPNADINFAAGVKNNYLYNGKELQEELGQLDYGARFYDPAIARWSVLDPLAESHFDQSAYSYVLNNPTRFIDPFGLKEKDPYDSNGVPIYKDWGDFDPYEDEIYLKGVNITNYDKLQDRLHQEAQDRINARLNGLISTLDGLNLRASIYQDNMREAAQKKADQDRNANIARNEKRKAFLKGNFGTSGNPIRGAIGGPVPWYGNFLGPGPDANPYKLIGYNGKILRPLDMLDAAAQRHDAAYDAAKVGGVNGALFRRRVAAADQQLGIDALVVIATYYRGGNDTITGQKITAQELIWAERVAAAFMGIGGYKVILGGPRVK
jgi:RHS repeat-associated protein